MLSSGLNLFMDTEVVIVTGTPQEVILTVDTGVVDIGFLTAGDLEKYTLPTFVPETDFRYVNRINDSTVSFPAPRSTTLYPGSLLAALPHTSLEDRTALAQRLMNLTSDQLDANISRWIAFQNYAPVRNIQSQLRVLMEPPFGQSHGSCLSTASTVTDFITCPPGYIKQTSVKCLLNGRLCPSEYMCLCNPCVALHPPYKKIFGSVIPLSFVLVIMAFCIYRNCCYFKMDNLIPYDLLNIDPKEPIGESSEGQVLIGAYFGSTVAVKRSGNLSMNNLSLTKSPFDVHQDERHQSSSSAKNSKAEKLSTFFLDFRQTLYKESHRMNKASKIQHANILPMTGISHGPSRKDLLTVSPFMKNGTVYDIMMNKTFIIDGKIIAPIIRDVCDALTFLHDIGKFGADVRPHHLLLDDTFHVRLNRSEPVRTDKQTSAYKLSCAPEVISADRPTSPDASSDVYSIGMLMYELFYRKQPYEGESASDIMASWRPPKLDISRDTDELEQVMQACWSNKAIDRPALSTLTRIVKNHTQASLADALFVEPSRGKLLLKSALPINIAVALKEGKRVESQQKKVSLCLFSIIEGSLQGCTQRIYSMWDEISQSLGLYRLTTVDDSYLVVGNLHVNQEDHALRIAKFSLKAMSMLDSTDIGNQTRTSTNVSPKARNILMARGAIHCGEVTANILGYSEPRFVLLGTPMTVLCRISSSTEQGHIQISRSMQEQIKPSLEALNALLYQRDGSITVRGQGRLTTFWLVPNDKSSLNRSMIRVARLSTNKDIRLDSRYSELHTGSETSQGGTSQLRRIRSFFQAQKKRVLYSFNQENASKNVGRAR